MNANKTVADLFYKEEETDLDDGEEEAAAGGGNGTIDESTVDVPDGEPSKKKPRVEVVPETKVVKKCMKFAPLEKALAVDWKEAPYIKRVRRMDPAFFVLHVLYEFESREGRNPSAARREEDEALLRELVGVVTERFALKADKIPCDRIVPLLFSELSPVASIVGGVLAQEVIKVVSNQDAPHKNFFLFNPLDSSGVVENVGDD